jgi:hypothetical protein
MIIILKKNLNKIKRSGKKALTLKNLKYFIKI